MAHGFLRKYANAETAIYSAGIQTDGVNPRVIETMQEIDIDVSKHTSNNVAEYTHLNFDFILSLCDTAKERCPYFSPGATRFHFNVFDPYGTKGTSEEIAEVFRSVRDDINEYCKEFAAAYLR